MILPMARRQSTPTARTSTEEGDRIRTPRGEGDRLRTRLIDAAAELLDERGDASELSIRAVTSRAGVSPMALYLHFDGREALLYAVLERGFDTLRSALQASVEGLDEPRARLHAMGVAYIGFARERPALYTAIFGPVWPEGAPPEAVADGRAGDEPPKAAGAQAFGDLVVAVTAVLAGDGRDPEQAIDVAHGIWTGLHGFVLLSHARPRVAQRDPDAFISHLMGAWLPPPAP
jgi:AcrR family transcriptional regulator